MELTYVTRVFAQECVRVPGMFCVVPEQQINIDDRTLYVPFHFAKYRTIEEARADAKEITDGDPGAYFMIDHDWHLREEILYGVPGD